MQIILSKSAGFCFGVKRAVNLVESIAKKSKTKICTLGPLIHNSQEVERLSSLGVKSIRSLDKLNNAPLLIPAHGIPLKIWQKLKKKKLQIIDATCPFVKRVQNLVKSLTSDGYQVIIVGEKDHPEVKAVVSYAKVPVSVIKDSDEIKILKDKFLHGKIAVVSQTTQSLEKFKKIVLQFKKIYKEIKVFNTICNAAVRRQKEAQKLAEKVNLMIVIGGRNSANTRQLVNVCKKYVNTYHIETPDEISKPWLVKNTDSCVGISAGASTPRWLIKKVLDRLKNE